MEFLTTKEGAKKDTKKRSSREANNSDLSACKPKDLKSARGKLDEPSPEDACAASANKANGSSGHILVSDNDAPSKVKSKKRDHSNIKVVDQLD